MINFWRKNHKSVLVSVLRDLHVDTFPREMDLDSIVHSKMASKETLPNHKQPAGTQFSQWGIICAPFTLPRFSDILLSFRNWQIPRREREREICCMTVFEGCDAQRYIEPHLYSTHTENTEILFLSDIHRCLTDTYSLIINNVAVAFIPIPRHIARIIFE